MHHPGWKNKPKLGKRPVPWGFLKWVKVYINGAAAPLPPPPCRSAPGLRTKMRQRPAACTLWLKLSEMTSIHEKQNHRQVTPAAGFSEPSWQQNHRDCPGEPPASWREAPRTRLRQLGRSVGTTKRADASRTGASPTPSVCLVLWTRRVPVADGAGRARRPARTQRPRAPWTVPTGTGGRRRFRSLPVRAVGSSRRDAVDADIGFDAQDGLVLALGRHLDSTVIDVGVVVWLWLIYSVLFLRGGGGGLCVRFAPTLSR